jgi:hypothetical protein
MFFSMFLLVAARYRHPNLNEGSPPKPLRTAQYSVLKVKELIEKGQIKF